MIYSFNESKWLSSFWHILFFQYAIRACSVDLQLATVQQRWVPWDGDFHEIETSISGRNIFCSKRSNKAVNQKVKIMLSTEAIVKVNVDPFSEPVLTLSFSKICSFGQETSKEDDLCHSTEFAERLSSNTHFNVAIDPAEVVTSAMPKKGIERDCTWICTIRIGSNEKNSSFSVFGSLVYID